MEGQDRGQGRLQALLNSSDWAALRRALDAGITDSAASLTYYVILSMVPCITLIVAIVGLIGRDPQTTDAILEVIQQGGASRST
jgi:uncharacterized BrkB/YihY/UPF0761 family membrane protein